MMKKVLKLIVVGLFFVIPASAFSGPMEIPHGAICHACGMKVDPGSPFAAQIVDGGKLLAFCDIGDMLGHYKKMENKPGMLYVKDFSTGKWTDALAASYVKSHEFKTPMGWGIAAFGKKEEALKAGKAMTMHRAMGMLGSGMHEMDKMKGMEMH